MKKTNNFAMLLLAAVALMIIACSKDNEQKAEQAASYDEIIIGRWNLESTNDVPTPWYRSTIWEFTSSHEWTQTLVYNDGEHYDSVVNHSTWSIEGDSITFVQDNGVISGVRIDLIDGDIMKTRDWYQGQFQPDGAWFTYVFSRIE